MFETGAVGSETPDIGFVARVVLDSASAFVEGEPPD
jgi:hypothetical protein